MRDVAAESFSGENAGGKKSIEPKPGGFTGSTPTPEGSTRAGGEE